MTASTWWPVPDPTANDGMARQILLQAAQSGYQSLDHFREALQAAGVDMGRDRTREMLNQLSEEALMTRKTGASNSHQWVTVADTDA